MNNLQQLLAISVLLGQCEAIAESGVLGEKCESELRWSIAKTLTAFNMPTRSDRQDNTSTSEYDAQLDQVGVEITAVEGV